MVRGRPRGRQGVEGDRDGAVDRTAALIRRLSFELRYRFGKPRWDTGVTPPELVSFVERTRPGRALDLGCGTGTNAVYLATHGWEAVGIDFSPKAMSLARARAGGSGVARRVHFILADVTRPPDLGAPFGLVLDIGCLHSVPVVARESYARVVTHALRAGGTYLLYAFCPPDRYGIAREEVESLFGPALALESFVEGTGRASAWYRFATAGPTAPSS